MFWNNISILFYFNVKINTHNRDCETHVNMKINIFLNIYGHEMSIDLMDICIYIYIWSMNHSRIQLHRLNHSKELNIYLDSNPFNFKTLKCFEWEILFLHVRTILSTIWVQMGYNEQTRLLLKKIIYPFFPNIFFHMNEFWNNVFCNVIINVYSFPNTWHFFPIIF